MIFFGLWKNCPSPTRSYSGDTMYKETLTATKKDKAHPVILQRDGDGCFYCKLEGHDPRFIPEIKGFEPNFDHLDDNPENNAIENLVLAHQSCNVKKRTNYDWKIKALEKQEQNKVWISPLGERERVGEGQFEQHKSTAELKEPDINLVINKLVKSYLQEKLPKDSPNNLYYAPILRSLHYLTIQQTGGRGSEQAVRRSLDAFCSEFSSWEDYKDGTGKRMIRRRTGS